MQTRRIPTLIGLALAAIVIGVIFVNFFPREVKVAVLRTLGEGPEQENPERWVNILVQFEHIDQPLIETLEYDGPWENANLSTRLRPGIYTVKSRIYYRNDGSVAHSESILVSIPYHGYIVLDLQ